MNSFLAGALSGTVGALNKYDQIQQDQNQFNIQQQLAAAEDMRKRSFAKYNYEMKDLYSPSGKVDESGRSLSKKEAQETPGTAMMSQKQWEDQEIEKKRVKKAGIAEELHQKRRKEKIEDAAAIAETKATTKKTVDDEKFVSNFRKEVNRATKGITDKVEEHQAIANVIEANSNDERLVEEAVVQKYLTVEGIANDLIKGKEAGKSREEVEARLKKAGSTQKEIDTAIELLELEGGLEKGWIPFTGFKGKGW